MNRVAFGGGCHWCTEAVFQSLRGVENVEQGWIASEYPDDSFSEGVVVHYNEDITLEALVEVHLLTHSSTSLHSMRKKYRSAVYYFDEGSRLAVEQIISNLALAHNASYVTRVLPLLNFKGNMESYLNYYKKNRQAPFCRTYINPKLSLIREKFHAHHKDDF